MAVPDGEGVRASLNFHEFVSNPQPLGFTGVAGKPLLLRPLSGVNLNPHTSRGSEKEVGKPAHLEEDVEGCVQLPVQGETTPLTPESPTFRQQLWDFNVT